ncbi:Predicted arabinose efflux permease, MFS family [Nakamurella panacisegetis]|uniref:Predicted arabinose efflux permease, MFS family n=1 Tax=Nakamurella panacisegetis TaxID=1090615 RepID=A0A1H0QTH7_9ACTN|nr:MFS transporter [Nakamurella panacisegetis]SDP20016.1 Predicted arabinose efflux permease, MFS family [Nakamurella panacisegetis]
MGLATYLGVLRHGPAAWPFAATVVARLPIAMAPLGMVVLIQHVRGSYGIAGVVTGAFAVGIAIGAPIWGRLMDRLGQARIILPIVLASAALLAALSIGAVQGAGNPALVTLATLAGVTFPPFSAAMRSTWRMVLPDGPDRRAGYALDAVAVESLFVGGPLILSLLVVITPPAVPLLVSAGLLAVGGALYCSTEPARRRPERLAVPGERTASDRPALVSPTLVLILGVSALMSIGFGVIDTSLAATARQVLGHQGELGLLFACIAGASVVGGLVYGARSSQDREHRRLPFALGLFALGLAPVPALISAGRPPLWSLMPLLFLAGLAIAPALIMLQTVVDRAAPSGRHNEAQAWLTTSNTTGGAAGTAVAGVLIDSLGVAASFAAAVLAVVLSCGLAVRARYRLQVPLEYAPA